jgi:hypothetical protein
VVYNPGYKWRREIPAVAETELVARRAFLLVGVSGGLVGVEMETPRA